MSPIEELREAWAAYESRYEAWLKHMSKSPDIEVVKAVRAVLAAEPVSLHPEALEHGGKTFRKVEFTVLPSDEEPEEFVLRYPDGRTEQMDKRVKGDILGLKQGFYIGALNCGAALYREIKPRVWEFEGPVFENNWTGRVVAFLPDECDGVKVKIVATEVLP